MAILRRIAEWGKDADDDVWPVGSQALEGVVFYAGYRLERTRAGEEDTARSRDVEGLEVHGVLVDNVFAVVGCVFRVDSVDDGFVQGIQGLRGRRHFLNRDQLGFSLRTGTILGNKCSLNTMVGESFLLLVTHPVVSFRSRIRNGDRFVHDRDEIGGCSCRRGARSSERAGMKYRKEYY